MTRPAGRRPPRDYRTGRGTGTVRTSAWLIVAAGLALVAVRYPALPETVPVHFGITGAPDRYGPKSALLWLTGLWVALHTGMSWLSSRPEVFNYPVPVTAENAQRLYREGERLMISVMAATDLVFLGIALLVATGSVLGTVVLVAGLAAAALATVAGLIRTLH